MPFIFCKVFVDLLSILNAEPVHEDFTVLRPKDHCCFLTLSLHHYKDASLWVAIANANRDVEFPLKDKEIQLPKFDQAKQYAKNLFKEKSFNGRVPWPSLGVWDLLAGQTFGPRWNKAVYIETERWAFNCEDFSSPDETYVLAERKWTEHDEGRNWGLWLVSSVKKTGKTSIVNALEGGVFENPLVAFRKDSRKFVYRLTTGWLDADLTKYMYIFGSVNKRGTEVESRLIPSNQDVAPSTLLELGIEKAQEVLNQAKGG